MRLLNDDADRRNSRPESHRQLPAYLTTGVASFRRPPSEQRQLLRALVRSFIKKPGKFLLPSQRMRPTDLDVYFETTDPGPWLRHRASFG